MARNRREEEERYGSDWSDESGWRDRGERGAYRGGSGRGRDRGPIEDYGRGRDYGSYGGRQDIERRYGQDYGASRYGRGDWGQRSQGRGGQEGAERYGGSMGRSYEDRDRNSEYGSGRYGFDYGRDERDQDPASGEWAANYGYGFDRDYGSTRGYSDDYRERGRRNPQGYGYGGERERWSRGGQGGEERGFFERAADEVTSWFGDEDAARRRRMDEFRGRGPKSYKRSDERIREDVNDRLTEDWSVDATDVEVTVSNGEVTLSGHVPSRDQRRRAEDVAEQVSGVGHVQNNLRVKGSSEPWVASGASGSITPTVTGSGGTAPSTGTAASAARAGTPGVTGSSASGTDRQRSETPSR